MQSTERRDWILELLRTEFRRERSSGFAMLRRIPSTNVRKFLDYFRALEETEKDALAEGLAERALLSVCPEADDRRPAQVCNSAWRKYVDALPLMWDWKYEDVRGLRMRLALAKSEPGSAIGSSITQNIRKWIETIKPVKSTDIRKVVKLALSQIIAPLRVTHAGQYWDYEGLVKCKAISVTVDYSSRHHQLDYWVSTQDNKRGFYGLNYERIMGLAFAHWDCLEETNLDQSMALLKEHILYCADMLERLQL